MTVTELAILPLTHPLSPSSPSIPSSLAQKLATAKTAMKNASGYEFLYYQQIEDPSILYILGRWESVAHHTIFLGSKQNLGLLELLKEDIVVNSEGGDGRAMSMWHVDADWSASSGEGKGEVFNASVISLGRHLVRREMKGAFEGKFEEVKGALEEGNGGLGVAGGWGIEKEGEEKEEWDLVVGWESVEQHEAFAKTEEFGKYKEIQGFLEGFEVKHLRAIL